MTLPDRASAGAPATPRAATAGAATLLFVLSASVLVLEILAARLLAPIVGLSLETYTAVIGVVLGGIAVGHAAGGWMADRWPWRTVLGPTVLAGGALGMLIVPIVRALGEGLRRPSVGDVLVLAVSAFFLPTAALSMAPPVVTKARLRSLGETGRVVGLLSAASTAGALCGTFATGFALVAAFPTTRIIAVLSGALVLLGVVLTFGLRARPVVAAVLVAAAAAAGGWPSLCDYETRYYCVRIVPAPQSPSARIVRLDTLSHSYVDLEDPARLGFRYQRVLAQALSARHAGSPMSVLHIGGGGLAFPRYVAAEVPGSRNTVMELDEGLADIAFERLDAEPAAIEVVPGDARVSMAAEAARRYDVVVADAFGSLDPPWHLATVEAAREVRRVLVPGGLYALDVVDAGRRAFLGAQIATLGRVFRHVSVVDRPGGSRELPINAVVLASDSPLAAAVDPADGRVLSAAEVAGLASGAPVLTDDYAPVERLVSDRR